MDITKSKGNIVELQVMSAFMSMGYDCSIPYGDGAKYDFIVDYNGELLKIQCKSCCNPKKSDGTRDKEAICLSTVAQTTNTVKTTRHLYNSEQIDYFATYYSGNGQVYVIPVEECSTSKTLRFSPPKNGNQNYNKAEDYLISVRFSSSIQSIEEDSFNSKKEYFCVKCKTNKVSKKGNICTKCSAISQRKVDRPEREELKMLIRNKSFLEIGRIYGVTDNAIRKWCRAEKLPDKKSEIKKITDEDWKLI